MKKTIFFSLIILMLSIVMISGVSATLNNPNYDFILNSTDGNGDLVNSGTATCIGLDMNGAVATDTSGCAPNYNKCSLTDGTNDMWQFNVSTTGAGCPIVVDSKNLTFIVYMNPDEDPASADFFAGDNDAFALLEANSINYSMNMANSSSYINQVVAPHSVNISDDVIIATFKQNASGWFGCMQVNANGTEVCTRHSANGLFQLENVFTLGDRSAGTKATKAYFMRLVAYNNMTLNSSEKECVENAIRAGVSSADFDSCGVSDSSDTTATDRVHFTNSLFKNNQSLYYTWQNPTDVDFNHTEMWSNGIFVGNFTTNAYNLTSRQNNTCYINIFIAVDHTGNKAVNTSDYQCTEQNNVARWNSTNTNGDIYLFRSKYQIEQGIPGGEASQRIYALDCNTNPTYGDICYAGTDTTTAWIWNRSIWKKIARNVTGVEAISSIIGDYNNPFYVCAWFGRMNSNLDDGTESGLYCSKDGGITWVQRIIGKPPRRQNNGQQIFYDTDTFNGTCTRNIYAGGDTGMFYSTNCGDTFASLNSIYEYVNDISGNSTGAYVATNLSLYYLRFSDNNMTKLSATGLTTSGNALRDCAVNISNNNMVICGSTDLYESWNKGTSFTLRYNPSGSVQRVYWGLHTMIISPDQVGGEKPYYSVDGGANWLNSDLNATQGFHVDDLWFYSSPVSCYADDSRCFVPFSSGGWIGVSDDYGATFNDLGSSGMSGYHVTDMKFPRKDIALLSAYDMGIRLTNLTSGQTWDLNVSGTGSDLSSSMIIVFNFTSIDDFALLTGYGGWYDQDIVMGRCINKVCTFTTVQATTYELSFGQACKDNEDYMVIGYAESTDRGFLYSTNRGTIWTDVPGYAVGYMDSLCNIYAVKDNGATLGIYNASKTDYTSMSLIVSATTAEIPQYGILDVDPFNTSNFCLPAEDSGVFVCTKSSCSLIDSPEGLTSQGNYKYCRYHPTTKGILFTGNIPNSVSDFPAYQFISFNGGSAFSRGFTNLGDMPSYQAFFNPYGTDEFYFSGAGLWKGTTAQISESTPDYPPLTATNLMNETVTNQSIKINWTISSLYGDENDTEIWLNGVNVNNVTYNDYKYENTSLQPSTEYRFDVITTDDAGNKGANATIYITTLPNNVTGEWDGSTTTFTSLMGSRYVLNLTFLQKPYFLSFNLTGNNTNPTTEDWQYIAYYQNCSNIDYYEQVYSCDNQNDASLSSYAYIIKNGYGWINKSFYNYANYTGQELYYSSVIASHYGKSYIYCENLTGSQLLNSKEDFGSGSTWTVSGIIPASCRQGTDIRMRYYNSLSTGTSGAYLYIYENRIYSVSPYYIQVLDRTILNSTNSTNNTFSFNMTDLAVNNMTGNKLNFTFVAGNKNTFEFDIDYAFVYNKSINVSIYETGTTDLLNPTCTFNGETIYPLSEIVYYNSSRTNILVCSKTFYSTLTYAIEPLYDLLNLTMTGENRTLLIVNEKTGLPFDVQNLSSVKLFYDNNATAFDFKSNNTNILNFTSLSNFKVRLELIYASGAIINRYIDLSLLTDTQTKLCANLEGTTHYEQLIISSKERPVIFKNTFSNCIIASDYTRFNYQNTKTLKAYSIDMPYYLYTWNDDDEQILLTSIDGSIVSYINLELLLLQLESSDIQNQQDIAVITKNDNITATITYHNTERDNTAVNVLIRKVETQEMLFNSSDFTNPNDFTILFNYANAGVLPNENAEVQITSTRSDGTTAIEKIYMDGVPITKNIPSKVAILLSILFFLFGITLTATDTTFNIFGVLVCIISIGILAFAVSAWYILFLIGIESIILVYIVIIMAYKTPKVI